MGWARDAQDTAESRRPGGVGAGSARNGPSRRGSRRGRAGARGVIYPLLLLSILVLGVAGAGVAQLWQTQVKREKEEELLFRLNQFRRAILQYRAAHNGYPRELKDLLEDRTQLQTRRYLRRIYKDPITGKDDWRLVLVVDRAGVVSGISDLKSRAEGKPLKSILGKKDSYQDW